MSGLETMPRAFLVGSVSMSKVSSTTGTPGAVTSGSPDVEVTIQAATFMAPTFTGVTKSDTATGTTPANSPS